MVTSRMARASPLAAQKHQATKTKVVSSSVRLPRSPLKKTTLLMPTRNTPNGFKTVKVRYKGREFTIHRAEDWYMEEHPETPRVTIEFPPMPIDYLGITGTHHVKLIESAPDTWECVIKNDITSGSEQDLPPEYRNMQRPLSLHETQIKHSILSHPELIDPEDQKNLRRVADPYAELTSPEEAA